MSAQLPTAADVDAKRPKLDQGGIGIVTHSGTHHADEALAVYLLRKLPSFRDLPLTRTRDAALIDQATIVVDVGATYEPEKNRFDHHQRGFDEVFDGQHKTKLSSAGLVWKHFGPAILSSHLSLPVTDSRINLLWVKLYDDFIEAIDGIDNGVPLFPPSAGSPAYKSRTDLSSRISYLNPSWNEVLPTDKKEQEADGMRRFERASRMAGEEFFDRVDYAYKSWLPARAIVEEALGKRKDVEGSDKQGRILFFEGYASWKDHLFSLEASLPIPEAEKPLYVVYPDESGKWRVQAVPESAESFISRRPLPEKWRGVRDSELSQLSGIEGCIFVHASGFIGGNETRMGALEMARKALE